MLSSRRTTRLFSFKRRLTGDRCLDVTGLILEIKIPDISTVEAQTGSTRIGSRH